MIFAIIFLILARFCVTIVVNMIPVCIGFGSAHALKSIVHRAQVTSDESLMTCLFALLLQDGPCALAPLMVG